MKKQDILKKEKKAVKSNRQRLAEKVERGESPLTHKQQRFVEEYILDQNATAAYRKAYGTSTKVAEANGARLLRNAKISALLKTKLGAQLAKIEITSESVLQKIAFIANGSLGYFLRINPISGHARVDLNKNDPAMLAVLSEYQYEESIDSGNDKIRKVKIKLKDSLRALELLGRYLKLFSEQHQRENEEMARILRAERAGELTAEEAGFELAILGLPLPEFLRIKLDKTLEPLENNNNAPTTEEIVQRAIEMKENIEWQREQFLPGRQQQVADMKEKLRISDSFSPELFKEEGEN